MNHVPYIAFDHCVKPQYHGAIKSDEMKARQDILPALTLFTGVRHGTVLTVPESIVR